MGSLSLALLAIIHVSLSELTHPSYICSSQEAFVETRASSNVSDVRNETLTSAQALFLPHNYYVAWSPLVVLTSSVHDDICNVLKPLSTNITNKIVLLFESIGDCGVHFKALVAQTNGASAVLMANNDLTGRVVALKDDYSISGSSTSIPMRSISKNDGELLYDEVKANHGVQVKFGCPDKPYPSTVCLTDPSGEFSDFSGNYQRQVESTVHDHPVWKLNGYANVRSDLYLYLHGTDSNTPPYWAATFDNTFSHNSKISLRCAAAGDDIHDPTFCPLWSGTNDKGKTFTNIPQINVTANLCPVGEQILCVDSIRHELAGLRGDYTLHSSGEPLWYRDLSDCDMRAGYLSFVAHGEYGDGYFIIDEPLNEWVIALCIIPSEFSENGTFTTAKWRPDLCNSWVTRDDIGLRYSPLHRYYDPTLNVSIGTCAALHLHTPQCVPSAPPETLCLANNSIIHGATMGQYTKLNETGPYFGSSVYQRIAYDNPVITNDTDTLYIWYANEFFAHFGYGDYLHRRQWILTPTPLDHAMKTGKYQYFGLCQGYAYGNVAKCTGWVFWAGAHHYDEQMTVTEAECTSEPFPALPKVWPQYICIGLKNASRAYGDILSTLDIYEIIGGYMLNESIPSDSSVVPVYVKPPNDYVTHNLYLFFSDEWAVINNQTSVKMVCDPYGKKSLNPIYCTIWYDDDWERLDNIYLYECDAEDVLTFSPTSAPTRPTINPTFAPTVTASICLSRNGTTQSLLEGVYSDSLGYRDAYGTIQFVSNNKYLGEDALFMWYYDNKWWISPVDYHRWNQSEVKDIDVYGYCEGGIMGKLPACEGCWIFYWELSPMNSGAKYIEDCLFTLYWETGVCDVDDNVYDGSVDYVDSVCLNKMNDHIDNSRYDDEYSKEERDDEHTYENINDVPIDLHSLYGKYDLHHMHYEKSDGKYIWHNNMTNHWFVGDTLYGDALLLCHEKNAEEKVGIPVECLVWDKDEEMSKHIDNVLSVTEQCIQMKAHYMFGVKTDVFITILVAVVAVCVISCGLIVCFWFKCKRKKVHQNAGVTETEFVETKHRKKKQKTGDEKLVENKNDAPYDMTVLHNDDAARYVKSS